MATIERKKQANSKRRGTEEDDTHHEIIFREDGQEYAKVLRYLGDGRYHCACYDGVARVGLIRGAMRKKKNVSVGNIVIVGLRNDETSDRKCDLIHLYTTNEASELEALGELSITPFEETARYIKYQEELAATRAHEEKERQEYLPNIAEI